MTMSVATTFLENYCAEKDLFIDATDACKSSTSFVFQRSQ